MRFHLDRPADRLLTERLELVAGWIEGDDDTPLSLIVGARQLSLRRCVHPGVAGGWLPAHAQGFYTYLALQEVIDAIRSGFIAVDFIAGNKAVQRETLRVSPTAVNSARDHALDLASYPVGARHNPFPPSDPSRLIIFPSLGAVGGSSINWLFRLHMYRNRLAFPVFEEANDAALWISLRAKAPQSPMKWIDGHDCYAAGDCQALPWARITLLRDPLPRMVTVFNYGRIVTPYDFPFSTFDEFLASPEFRRYSQAFGLLRVAGRSSFEAEHNDDVLYREARATLREDYDLVGITERFEETIFLICLLADLSTIGMWWRVLSTPRGLQVTDLPTDVRKRAEKTLEVDSVLYSEAKEGFSRLVEVTGFGPELQSYKDLSGRRSELDDSYKMAECLRWRQLIVEQRMLQGNPDGRPGSSS